jgi:predicted unusual protein kinase regulating ubiquinone biosynthesis (AarF/ABC1/UbiB family)
MTIAISTRARERDIITVLIRYSWDYMRQVLTLGSGDEPQLPAPEVLCQILQELGPVYVKLGQLLSTRPDLLSQKYINALSQLQTNVPPVSWDEIQTVLRQQLPQSLDDVFSWIEPRAIAAGSIAQTHKAMLKTGELVAVKIQRPGIDLIVAQDIAVFKEIAGLLAGTDFGKRYNIVALADEFAQSLQRELDFTQEASYTEQLRNNLANSQWVNSSQIVVPKVYQELTSAKILGLEWLDGVPILEAKIERDGIASEAPRHEFTRVLFRAFIQQYLVDGFFHADPHPGNLFYLKDGRAGILDCGMMGTLNPRMQSVMVELMLAVLDLDAARCTQLTLQLAEPMDSSRPIELANLQADYDRLLRQYYNLSLSNLNVGDAFSQVLEAARMNNLRLPSNVGLLTKSMANLEGSGRQFDPNINIMDEMRPLMNDLFRRQLTGDDLERSLLRTALELKQLSLESPRQVGFLLERLGMETFKLNLAMSQDIVGLRQSMEGTASQRSLSTLVGALIVGAAIVSANPQNPRLQILSTILFVAASLLGLWLIWSLLRAGRVKK